MPRGNLSKILLGLGLWALKCVRKTLQKCTHSNLQRNKTNGARKKSTFLFDYISLYIKKDRIASPENDHAKRKSAGHIACVMASKFHNFYVKMLNSA
jgi:hypothetical protein